MTELYNLSFDIAEKNQLNQETELNQLAETYENWLKEMKNPIFFGLMQDDEYNQIHPDRFQIKAY